MKYIITENQMRNLQFDYLDYLFKDIYEVRSKGYPNSIFWKKDDKTVLALVKSNRDKRVILWVFSSIWDDISNMLSLKYKETKKLIKNWSEQHLELEGIEPERTDYLDI